MPSRQQHSRGLLAAALGLVTAVAGLGLVTSAGSATADVANDPLAATAYQQNPAHDGDYQDANFSNQLQRAWSLDLGGNLGYPIIANGLVYVAIAGSNEVDVEALSLQTGAVVWGPKAMFGGYGQGSLAYDDGRLFLGNSSGQMTAYDAATGAKDWVAEMPGQSEFTAPTAADGTIYLGGSGSGGTLYAVDEATGDVKWTGFVMNGDVSIPSVGDDGVFASYACNQAYRFNLDGSLGWHHTSDCEGGGGATTVVHDGRVYTRDYEGDLVLDAGTGHLVDSYASDTVPAFDDSHMATTSGGALAVWDSATGTRLWKTTTTDNVTPPIFANGYVVEGQKDGMVELRNEDNGSVAWSASAGSSTSYASGLAVGDGALVVPAGSKLTTFLPGGPNESVSIADGPAQDSTVGPDVTFSFSSNVPDASYVCTLDGSDSPCTSPITYSNLSNGQHSFSVTVAGTAIHSETRTFTVQSGSYSIWVDGPSQDKLVGRYALFDFGSNLGNASYSCSLDHRTPKPCSPPQISFRKLHSGPHTFTVSIDGFPSTTTTRAFTSYDDGPVVRLARIRPTVTHQPKVAVHWSATDPFGVAFSQLRVKRAAHGHHMSGWTKLDKRAITSAHLAVPRGGRLCVSVRAIDRASEWSHWTSPQCVVRAATRH